MSKLLIFLLFSVTAFAQPVSMRTCRVVFLAAPAGAPEKLQLFDGAKCREVDLPRMNFSPVYKLPGGALNLCLLPKALTGLAKVPAGAPTVAVPEAMTDFYLLVSSDPANVVAPVRMQVVNVGDDKLKRGQMLWFNLTRNEIIGTLGTEKLAIAAGARAVLDAPTRGNADFPVSLSYRMPGNNQLYPLCETRWRQQDPRSRSVTFVIPQEGLSSPRVMGFSDIRDGKMK